MRRTFSLSLLGLLALPLAASAQFRAGYDPAAGYGYAQTQTIAGANSRPASCSYAPAAAAYFGPYQRQTPMNGFLTGSADVMNATGQYEIQHQQGNLTKEQVKSAHIDNRRKMFDELRYEKANTPTLWQVQAERRYEQLQQARNSPQPSEIWAAIPLNLLLADVRQIQAGTGLRRRLDPARSGDGQSSQRRHRHCHRQFVAAEDQQAEMAGRVAGPASMGTAKRSTNTINKRSRKRPARMV